MADEKVLVITSGYFDPLHVGHIECFELAKKLGDALLVIVNNDAQLKIKKGGAFMPQEQRQKIVQTLKPVDMTFMSVDNDDVTSKKSLEAVYLLNKDKFEKFIFAKGGDRYSYEIPESEICKKYRIQIIDGLGAKIQSSSWLIESSNKNLNNSKNGVKNS